MTCPVTRFGRRNRPLFRLHSPPEAPVERLQKTGGGASRIVRLIVAAIAYRFALDFDCAGRFRRVWSNASLPANIRHIETRGANSYISHELQLFRICVTLLLGVKLCSINQSPCRNPTKPRFAN